MRLLQGGGLLKNPCLIPDAGPLYSRCPYPHLFVKGTSMLRNPHMESDWGFCSACGLRVQKVAGGMCTRVTMACRGKHCYPQLYKDTRRTTDSFSKSCKLQCTESNTRKVPSSSNGRHTQCLKITSLGIRSSEW